MYENQRKFWIKQEKSNSGIKQSKKNIATYIAKIN